MSKTKEGFAYTWLWMWVIIVFWAGPTLLSCKPAQKVEEVKEEVPAEAQPAPVAPAPEEVGIPAQVTPAPETTFKWTPAKAGVTKAQVSLGRAVVCPFEFGITDPKIKKVKFSIKEEKIAKMGIIVADEEVATSEGKAASSAMFSVPAGTRLGNYELTIVAKDAATGEVIGEGIIPFQLLPKGAGGC
jgi:hypothetical protein